ncbi:MAG: nuclear transport factor 2 family protein [Bacteroidia bacterium]|nr:nuclear transport factor 2 family protein [Bacteroidia bacterium]
MKYYVMIAALLFTIFTVSAQSKEEKEVANAVEQLRKAMVDADGTMLEKLTSPILSYGHSSGKIEDKAEYVSSIVSGKSDFVTMDLTEQVIRISGNTATVRHILDGTTNDGGKTGTVKLKVLLVWQKIKGGWKLLARQAVK